MVFVKGVPTVTGSSPQYLYKSVTYEHDDALLLIALHGLAVLCVCALEDTLLLVFYEQNNFVITEL